MTGVTPIKLDFSECDLDGELEESGSAAGHAQENAKRRLPKLLIATGGGIVILAAAIFSVVTVFQDEVAAIGKPKLDNAKLKGASAATYGGASAFENDEQVFREFVALRSNYFQPSVDAPKMDKRKSLPSNEEVGRIEEFGKGAYFYLNPVAVSVPAIGRTVNIYLSLAFEADKPTAKALYSRGRVIKEDLIQILKSMDGAAAHEWDAAPQIRNKIHQRVKIMLPDGEIRAVLVQDFVVF